MKEQRRMQKLKKQRMVGDWEYKKGILLAIGMPNSMTILYSPGISFRIGLYASACVPEPQAVPCLEHGVSGCGMIPSATLRAGYLDCRSGSAGVRFDCPLCRMRFGFFMHRRRIIYRLQVVSIRARRTLTLLDHQQQMDLWRKLFVHQNFIRCLFLQVWHCPAHAGQPENY